MIPLAELEEQQHRIVWEYGHLTQKHQSRQCKICHPEKKWLTSVTEATKFIHNLGENESVRPEYSGMTLWDSLHLP